VGLARRFREMPSIEATGTIENRGTGGTMSEQPDQERVEETPTTGPNENANRPDEDVDPDGRSDAG
jgi:hypothetical protein